MVKVTQGNFTANIIAHSVDKTQKEIITFELEYPRFVHSELMTHRVFSRNASSSRAIPINKMIKLVQDNPAMPTYWGENRPGMSAIKEIEDVEAAKGVWLSSMEQTIKHVEMLDELGVHKQITNRILEPYQMIKVLVTSTEWNNWFWLRDHPDAQPEIETLALLMAEAKSSSEPFFLNEDEWHLPYIDRKRIDGKVIYGNYTDDAFQELQLSDALKVSSSLCAQTSYRIANNSLEKALEVYEKLVVSEPVHASPFEHQATPIVAYENEGVTHMDKYGKYWSGNFCGWIQHRQLISNNSKRG